MTTKDDDFARRLFSARSQEDLNRKEGASNKLSAAIETKPYPPQSGSPSQSIGNYKLLQPIGEGGMGTVWMADQTEPVKRRVALKLIKTGRDSKPIIARFEAERQALALMDHSSIAKILDGGTTESGQPYFVMELVQGIPITQYCDKHRLGLPERLGLFKQVCNAVQHAHQKGIIHRDLKPANVLVGVYDGKPVPKVIDFGLAKALDHQSKLTDKTLFTEFGAVVGTLQYMSPEQADLDAIDVDTRADVYALGVLLYELLTGSTPLEVDTIKQLAVLKVLESIRETDPPRPSTRLSSSSHQLVAISGNRQIDPARLQSELRGDLDWIVMKALEKDRSRRYESASGFAADVERYLTDQPVVARPPTNAYKLAKFFKKNRGSVIAAGTMLFLILAGLIGTSVGLLEAIKARNGETAQRKQAEKNLARAEMAEKETKERVKELEEITAFQTSQLSEIDVPMMGINLRRSLLEQFKTQLVKSGGTEAEATAQISDLEQKFSRVNFVDASLDLLEENIFKRAEKVIEDKYKDKPLLAAALLNAIGGSLQKLGKLQSAEKSLRRVVEICSDIHGDEHLDTLRSKGWLAALLQARGKTGEAESLCREVLGARRRILGSEDHNTLGSINNMANILLDQGKLSEAEPLFREALDACRRTMGNDHPDTLNTISSVASFLDYRGTSAEAESLCREAFETRRRTLGDDHPATLTSTNNMALLLEKKGKLVEAEQLYRVCLEARRRTLGDEHPSTLTSINNLALLFGRHGKAAEAEPLLLEALSVRKRTLGDDHPATITSLANLASFLSQQGKSKEAEQFCREALRSRRLILGNEHSDTLSSISNLAVLLRSQGELTNAEQLLRESLETSRRILGNDHPKTLRCFNLLAGLLIQERKLPEAESLLHQAIVGLADRAELKGLFLEAIVLLANIQNGTNRSSEAIETLKRASGNSDFRVFSERVEAYRQLGLRDESVRLVNEFVEQSRSEHAVAPKVLATALCLATRALNRMDEFALAEPLARESLELALSEKINGWAFERIRSTLGVSLLGLGRKDEARPLLESSFEALKQDEAKIPAEIRAETIEEAEASFGKLRSTDR